MDSELEANLAGIRETKLLIANSAIATKAASLRRQQEKVAHEKAIEDKLDSELYEYRMQRDQLMIERWGDGEPEWSYLLMNPLSNSHIIDKRCHDELEKIGLYSCGHSEITNQRIVGVAVYHTDTNNHLTFLSESLNYILPHIVPLDNFERTIFLNHASPESFCLQIRQHVDMGFITLVHIQYGTRKAEYFDTLLALLTYVRDNIHGDTWMFKTRLGFDVDAGEDF